MIGMSNIGGTCGCINDDINYDILELVQLGIYMMWILNVSCSWSVELNSCVS